VCAFRFGSLLVVNLAKETPLAVVKSAVHTALSCYLPTEFAPSPVSNVSFIFMLTAYLLT